MDMLDEICPCEQCGLLVVTDGSDENVNMGGGGFIHLSCPNENYVRNALKKIQYTHINDLKLLARSLGSGDALTGRAVIESIRYVPGDEM